MADITHAYLVEEIKSKKRRLIVAAAPANAIAHCAKGLFKAQRVDGAVLDTLTSTMELEHITPPKTDDGAVAGGDGETVNKPDK